MSEIIVLLLLTFITLIGFIIIRFFDFLPDVSNVESVFYSFGLGVSLISFQMFLYSVFAIQWSLISIIPPWLVTFFVMHILKPKFLITKTKLKYSLKFLDKVLIVIIFSLLLFVCFEALIRPLSAWDGWTSWLYKAKMFYVDGFINPKSLGDSEYPLVISLASSFIYTALGAINDRVVLLLFYMFYFSLAGIFFFSLKKYIGLTKALLFTFLLISTQNLIRHGGRFEAGQADLALGYYFFISGVLLLKFIKDKSYKTLILLNIFLGIAANIKNEGLPFSIFVQLIIMFIIFRTKKYKELLFSLFWFVPIFTWQLFKVINNFPKTPYYVGSVVHPDRIFVVIIEIFKEFMNVQNWNLLWFLFLVCSLLYLFKFKRSISAIYILIFLQLASYIVIFLVTPVNPVLHVRNVIDRLLIHLAPLAVFVSAVTLFSKFEKT